jgi:hypothetical protein
MKIPCPPTSPAAMHLATTPSKTRRKASLHHHRGPTVKHRCYKIFHTGADAGLHAVLHSDRAGHSRADQHPFRHLRQTNADGNALREPNPGECRVHRRKQLRSVAIVLVGNASRYAHDGSLQRGSGPRHPARLGAPRDKSRRKSAPRRRRVMPSTVFGVSLLRVRRVMCPNSSVGESRMRWRRGNGFEPPSRAVHTRALPIELPCHSKNDRAWI